MDPTPSGVFEVPQFRRRLVIGFLLLGCGLLVFLSLGLWAGLIFGLGRSSNSSPPFPLLLLLWLLPLFPLLALAAGLWWLLRGRHDVMVWRVQLATDGITWWPYYGMRPQHLAWSDVSEVQEQELHFFGDRRAALRLVPSTGRPLLLNGELKPWDLLRQQVLTTVPADRVRSVPPRHLHWVIYLAVAVPALGLLTQLLSGGLQRTPWATASLFVDLLALLGIVAWTYRGRLKAGRR